MQGGGIERLQWGLHIHLTCPSIPSFHLSTPTLPCPAHRWHPQGRPLYAPVATMLPRSLCWFCWPYFAHRLHDGC